jgi:predicted DNA-binding transcriptional regulator AlpA
LTRWLICATVGDMSQQAQTITTDEVARMLGKSKASVKRHAANGLLPIIGKIDSRTGAYLFDRGAIEAIAAERGAA